VNFTGVFITSVVTSVQDAVKVPHKHLGPKVNQVIVLL
jgi:hypothetical protein